MVAIANSISSNYVVSSGFDPSADAFITAAGITDPTQQNAINELVLDLKAASIWTKFNALYPIVGGTATTHKFNLINPLDTDAAFRLSFSTGWTHSSTGATPNGVNTYANTFLTPSTTLSQNNTHLSYYSRTNSNGTEVEVGATTAGNPPLSILEIRTSGITYLNLSANAYTTYTDANSQGFYNGTRTASNVIKLFKNGSNVSSGTTASTGQANSSLTLGAQNNGGSRLYYTTKQCAFASIGDGLTDTESQVFYQIVEKYQVALGRNINPTQSFYYNRNYNNETNAFLFATQITDTTQQTAVNTLVNDFKSAGIWTKMKAVYPIVGGTAATHKFNLVNPQDTNAAFRLAFSTGWTHSSTGMTPNGTSAYANTNLTPSTGFSSINNIHFSFYNRTSNAYSNSPNHGLIPATTTDRMYFSDQNPYYQVTGTESTTYWITFANTDRKGHYISTRTANNSRKTYKNGTVAGTNTNSDTGGILNSSLNFLIGAANGPYIASTYSSNQIAFSTLGDGLTDTEAANFYTAVQAFQTTLGRQV
jgi:hypothetical protein